MLDIVPKFGVKTVLKTYTIVRWNDHMGRACSKIFDEDEHEALVAFATSLKKYKVDFTEEDLKPS